MLYVMYLALKVAEDNSLCLNHDLHDYRIKGMINTEQPPGC